MPYAGGRHDGGASLESTVVCPSTEIYENLDHLQQSRARRRRERCRGKTCRPRYGLELKGYTRERICTYGWRLGDPAKDDEPEMFAKFATLVLASENPEIFDLEEELEKHRVGAAMLRLLRDQVAGALYRRRNFAVQQHDVARFRSTVQQRKSDR